MDMEEERKELEILKKGITYLQKAIECFASCDTVTKEEFRKIANYCDTLENRKIDLQIDIDGCIIQEG